MEPETGCAAEKVEEGPARERQRVVGLDRELAQDQREHLAGSAQAGLEVGLAREVGRAREGCEKEVGYRLFGKGKHLLRQQHARRLLYPGRGV